MLCAQDLEPDRKGGDIGILQAIIAASAVQGFSGTSFASLLTLAQGDSVTSDISDLRFRDPYEPLACNVSAFCNYQRKRNLRNIKRERARVTSRRNQALNLY